jgi:hypothetical protein
MPSTNMTKKLKIFIWWLKNSVVYYQKKPVLRENKFVTVCHFLMFLSITNNVVESVGKQTKFLLSAETKQP